VRKLYYFIKIKKKLKGLKALKPQVTPTEKMNKRSIVMDAGELNYGRKGKKQSSRTKAKQLDEVELESLLMQQRIKEKQLLQHWKYVRDSDKKLQAILRSQSRDVIRREKQHFGELNDDVKDQYVWKHEGCNNECKKDNCTWWLLEAGLHS
jgi:hypothetical protein